MSFTIKRNGGERHVEPLRGKRERQRALLQYLKLYEPNGGEDDAA